MHWYDLQELLPPVYAGVQSMYETAVTENIELQELYAIRSAILRNFFVQTCDVKTLQYWEQLLGIENYGGETIAQRRAMIMLYLVNNWQITKPYVQHVGEDYFGEGNFSIEYDENNHLIVYLRMTNADWMPTRKFMRWFEKVCPAHIQWDAANVKPSESVVVSTSNAIVADKMRCTASMVVGTEPDTIYLGQDSFLADWIEV